MKLSKYIFLILFLLTACYEKSSDSVAIPEDSPPLSPEKMSAVLTDIHLAQAALKTKQQLKEYHYEHNKKYHYQVFKKHNITQEEFDESLEYYKYHLEELDKIYENVLRNLSVMESQAEQDVQQQQDSLMNVESEPEPVSKDTVNKIEVLQEDRSWWGF